MVAIEALQWGLAIVGSQIGGMRDVVDEGRNGFLCELTAEGFADRLKRLATTPTLLEQMRRASREKAAEFDLEKIVSAYEDVLQASCVRAGGRSGL